MSVYDITAFGAAGDGRTDSTAAIRSAVAACAATGGGTVYVPAGAYETGPVELVDGMTLYLETGATLRFTDRFDAYPPTFTRWSGYECYGYRPLIYGRGLERVAIKGEGVIDGRGRAWWDAYARLKRKETDGVSPYRERLTELNEALYAVMESTFVEWETQFLRPPLLQLVDCRYVALEGVTLENSPFWNTHLVYCDEVKVRGVTFRNPHDTPNGDGLDLDSCTNVTVSDCQFDVGDDCLCLKSGINEDGRRVARPTEDVTVTNCIMRRGHGGIVFGSEMSGDIRRVVVSNCLFLGTDRGVRIKTNRARGGVVEDIAVSNVLMEGVLCPIAVNSFYRYGVDPNDPAMTAPEAILVTERTPVVRRLTISDVTARGARAAAAFVYGLPEMPIEDVSLRNVTIEMTTDPDERGGEPDMVKEELVMAGEGMFFKHVRHLELHRVRVETRQGPAVRLERVEAAELRDVAMRRKHPNARVVEGADGPARYRVFLAGDSTVSAYDANRAPQAGWGQALGELLPPGVEVRNHAASGRSTKSFIDEGRLAAIDAELAPGDLLLVQFGHNDQKPDAERRTEPYGTYQANLRAFIETARRRGASPVLVTSVQRRSFDESGELTDTHGEYPAAMRELARDAGVPLIDLAASSKALFEALGAERTKALFLWLEPGAHPNYPEGVQDDTHFCEAGAKEIAKLVVDELKKKGLLR